MQGEEAGPFFFLFSTSGEVSAVWWGLLKCVVPGDWHHPCRQVGNGGRSLCHINPRGSPALSSSPVAKCIKSLGNASQLPWTPCKLPFLSQSDYKFEDWIREYKSAFALLTPLGNKRIEMANEVFSEFAVCSPPASCLFHSEPAWILSFPDIFFLFFCGAACLGQRGAGSLTWSVAGEFVVFQVCTCIWDAGGYKGPCYITVRVIHFFFIISKIIFIFFLGC